MRTYRAGVIGLGNVGMLYELDEKTLKRYPHPSHTSAFAAHPRIELVAGCDLAADRRALFAQRYPNARAYQDLMQMLDREALDLVSVCVQPDRHVEVVEALLETGIPMIFCEKPLGTDAERARLLAEQCRKQGIGLVVDYWRRFDESHRQIAALIAHGSIGSLQHLHGSYGGGLWASASHVINLWLWYAGSIDWVAAVPGADDRETDPNINVLLGFASGAGGSLVSVSFQAYRLIEMDLFGTAGRISLKNEGLDLTVFGVEPNEDVSGAWQLAHEGQVIPSTVGTALDRAVDALVGWLDRGERPAANDAVETLAVLEAIERSTAEKGRKVVVSRRPVAEAVVR